MTTIDQVITRSAFNFATEADLGMKARMKRPPENAKEGAEEDLDCEHSHYGLRLIACDQSAITGESLAVDKYMGDTVSQRQRGVPLLTRLRI